MDLHEENDDQQPFLPQDLDSPSSEKLAPKAGTRSTWTSYARLALEMAMACTIAILMVYLFSGREKAEFQSPVPTCMARHVLKAGDMLMM
jgi:hypothetical protein